MKELYKGWMSVGVVEEELSLSPKSQVPLVPSWALQLTQWVPSVQ